MFERREGEPLNLKQLWHAALGELQLGLTKANYDTWFKDTAIVSEEDDVYCVGVPTPSLANGSRTNTANRSAMLCATSWGAPSTCVS